MRKVLWEGNSLDVLREFPEDVKDTLGFELDRVQKDETPLDFKPMKTVGPGVFELRDRDASGWYRLIYWTKISNRIYVLHVFQKKSRKTPREDLQTARLRLKRVEQRIRIRGE